MPDAESQRKTKQGMSAFSILLNTLMSAKGGVVTYRTRDSISLTLQAFTSLEYGN